MAANPYINPIDPAQWQTARTDQGVDYLPLAANTPVKAIGDATVVYSSTQTGWPGGAFLVYQLADGPMAGKYVYVAEHLSNLVPVGTQVKAGQQIAAAQPGYPWTEWGWASGNSDGVLTPYGNSPDGTQTGGGQAFARFLISLGASVLDDPGPGAMFPGGPTAPSGPGAGSPGTTAPSVPGLNNIPALDAYIRTNYPTFAWLLDEPAVKGVLEKAVGAPGGPDTVDQIQGLIAQTAWWKTTSANMQKFENLKVTSPEELNFSDPGSQVSQILAHVTQMAAQYGTNWGPTSMRTIATDALQYGWSDPQIQAKLGSLVTVTSQGAGVTSNDQQLLTQLKGEAGKYLYNPTAAQLQSFGQAIASGTMTMQGFDSALASYAAQKYPTMAAAIAAGQTPDTIIDPLRQEAATTMEVNPESINFISDPMYAKILNYTPPAVGGKAQAARPMSASEMDTYLRGTTPYSYTQQARNSAADLTKTITTAFGKAAS